MQSKQDIRALSQALLLARAHAIMLHKPTRICPCAQPPSWEFSREPICGKNWEAGFAVWESGEQSARMIREYRLHNPSAHIYSTRDSITFSPDGFAYGSNLKFHYESSISQELIISNTGRLRIE